MPQFDASFYIGQIFWLTISLLIIYWCLRFYVLPKLYNGIRLRNESTNDLIESVSSMKEELLNLKEESENLMTSTRHEISRIIAQNEAECARDLRSFYEKLHGDAMQQIRSCKTDLNNMEIDYAGIYKEIEPIIKKKLRINKSD